MKCTNCSLVRELAPEIRQTGFSDPPNAGWKCPVCKKEYHQYVKKEKPNMPKAWQKSVPEEWIKKF